MGKHGTTGKSCCKVKAWTLPCQRRVRSRAKQRDDTSKTSRSTACLPVTYNGLCRQILSSLINTSSQVISRLHFLPQTAEIIVRNNTHCSGMEMVLEPLLRERGFGVAEGRPKEDLKNMANAAGQSCGDYTPPGGETLDQLWIMSPCFQVKLRFKKFLKVLFKQMLEERGSSGPDAPAGASAAASAIAPGSSADDGLRGLSVHALVVSHGAYIRVAVRHLVEDLKCSLPPGVKMSQLSAPCPNTGISRFVLTLSRSESGPVLSAARCVFTNRKDHLENLTAAE
ncbi:fructose-2,6-bisphosphatase TIGAR B isoform X4 [Xiphias gladius]|uniref:fructose-2,6-bisphosphatase TIGAR B isoform X4 n=1 Tax=Xiphias gladius TaxID=8245 RepID=UPI001A986F69|nr:fructose-2,6-bisphosphatase TIGAR B isoform X4 [Xiphias gladius]